MSVLWEIPEDDINQLKLRQKVVRIADEILEQVGFWMDAAAVGEEKRGKQQCDQVVAMDG
jgi:hypothetical protein